MGGFTPLDQSIVGPWLALVVTGQWTLLALLITYILVKHLPQRDNPFLVNFIVTTFLGTIPSALLLYSGNRFATPANPPPARLCIAQIALIDGILPMFGVAQVVLVFDTWSELRSLCMHKRHMTRIPVVKYLLIFAPYVAMWIWTLSSFIATVKANLHLGVAVGVCVNATPAGGSITTGIGLFMVVFAILEIIIEFWVGWMIYSYPAKVQKDPTTWRTNIQFALRILILSMIQFVTIFLSILNTNPGVNNHRAKLAYQLLIATNGLATFLAFGTQKSILKAWKFWGRKAPQDPEEVQPQGYPTLNWADVPKRQPMQFDGDAFEREEKGQPPRGYMKVWQRLGRKWTNRHCTG